MGPKADNFKTYEQEQIEARHDEARRSLREVMSLPANGLTIGQAMSAGNRAAFALAVLAPENDINEQTFSLRMGGEKEKV